MRLNLLSTLFLILLTGCISQQATVYIIRSLDDMEEFEKGDTCNSTQWPFYEGGTNACFQGNIMINMGLYSDKTISPDTTATIPLTKEGINK